MSAARIQTHPFGAKIRCQHFSLAIRCFHSRLIAGAQMGSVVGPRALDSLRCEMGERTAAGICSPVRFGVQLLQTHRAANVRVMVSRLAVSTPQPTHLPKPSSPLSRHLPRYSRRFMTLMRPSIPALNLLALLYHPCPSYSSRSALLLP